MSKSNGCYLIQLNYKQWVWWSSVFIKHAGKINSPYRLVFFTIRLIKIKCDFQLISYCSTTVCILIYDKHKKCNPIMKTTLKNNV